MTSEGLDFSSRAGRRTWQGSKSPHVPKKLQKYRRYTFNDSRRRHDSCLRRVSADSSASHTGNLPPPKSTRTKMKPHILQADESIDGDNWAPKLQRTSACTPSHRRSRQQREKDNARENKIRAMSTHAPTPGKGSLSRRLANNRMSLYPGDDQFPSINSFHLASSSSSLACDSDCTTTYVLSGLELLSARPKIKFITKSRNVSHTPSHVLERSTKRKRQASDPGRDIKTTQKVHDLVYSLNAHELRELMERDQKRRDRISLVSAAETKDTQKARQEKQKLVKQRYTHNPESSFPSEIQTTRKEKADMRSETLRTISKKEENTANPSENERDNFLLCRSEIAFSLPSYQIYGSPITNTVGETSKPVSGLSEVVAEPNEVIMVDKFNSFTMRSSWWADILSKKKSLSQILLPRKTITQATPILSERPADDNIELSAKPPQSWTSFFKLRSRNKRVLTPASVSSVSRSSMPLGQSFHATSKDNVENSSLPKRTVSKFREDLPELPISPPDSRVQSPEVEDSLQMTRIGERYELSSVEDLRNRYDTPCSSYTYRDKMRRRNETPSSSYRTAEASSPEPHTLSQSLASIDSEASWLSGGKTCSRRSSHRIYQRSNDGSISKSRRYQDLSEFNEENESGKGENFSQMCSIMIDQRQIQMAWSDNTTGVLSENTKWGAVARRPNVVHRSPVARKSRECLLNSLDADSELSTILTPTNHERNNSVCADMICSVSRASSLGSSRRYSKLSLEEELNVKGTKAPGPQDLEK